MASGDVVYEKTFVVEADKVYPHPQAGLGAFHETQLGPGDNDHAVVYTQTGKYQNTVFDNTKSYTVKVIED